MTGRSSDFPSSFSRIDGARYLEDVVGRLRAEIAAAGNPPARLGTVLVSGDPRDFSNARRKHAHAEQAGMQSRHVQLGPRATQAEVAQAVGELAASPDVHGVFIQLPLPPHLDAGAILDCIPVRKDVDGLSARSLGELARGNTSVAPATPRGIIGLLMRHGIDVHSAATVIVGSSVEIAISLALVLKHESKCGSVRLVSPDARDLAAITREADIVVSCAERPGLIGAAHIRPGATVVDAGYNRTKDGVTGDVDVESIASVAGALVPMPNGIGPATIATLLEKTWACARSSPV
jgi:methylenetetrahydrofolate dehydrogenase (NADP+)/methenyltetrahydrofolate cyclohydrolase